MFKKKRAPLNKSSSLQNPNPVPDLEAELRRALNVPLEKGTVCKDLPRLAQRIVVIGTLGEESRRVKEIEEEVVHEEHEGVYRVYWNVAEGVELDIEYASEWPYEYRESELRLIGEGEETKIEIWGDGGALLSTELASRIRGVRDSERYFLVEFEGGRRGGFAFFGKSESRRFVRNLGRRVGVELVKKDDDSLKAYKSDVCQEYIEEKKVDELSQFAMDMLSQIGSSSKSTKLQHISKVLDNVNTRLCKEGGSGMIRTSEERRFSLRLIEQSKVCKNSVTHENLIILAALHRVITSLSRAVETPECAAKFESELTNLMGDYINNDGQFDLILSEFFSRTRSDSITAKICKALTQSIVHIATYHIKTKVQSGILTGDVKGPKGWQIVVMFAHDVINISHRRREKSLDVLGPSHNFWFEWILYMTFDRKMNDLISCTLKICDIHYGDHILPDIKSQLSRTFCEGNLLL